MSPTGSRSFLQPLVHVAAEQGRLLVHGVTRQEFFQTLTGAGHALGAAFHAGGFRPLLKRSVGTIRGRANGSGCAWL